MKLTQTTYLVMLIFFGMTSYKTFAQNNAVSIEPGQEYTNNTSEKLYYLPLSKVMRCIDLKTRSEFDSLRIEKYKELSQNYQERISLADSAAHTKNLEAEFWRQKLLANDAQLEEQRKEVLRLTSKVQDVKRSRMYFFVAGILATSIAVVAIN